MTQEGVRYVIEAEISQAMSNFNSLASQLKKMGMDVDDTRTDFLTLSEVLEETGEGTKDIEDDLDGLGNGLNNAGEEATGAKNEVESLANTLKKFLTVSAIVATGKKVIDIFTGFQDQMNTVSAVSGATGETLALLSAQAKELGASTNYSATEAGSAQEALMRLGYSANETMDAVAAVLAFDRANGVESLGKSAEYLGSVTKLFGLEAKEATRVADAMSQTTRNSKTDVDYLASALNNAGSDARNFGYDIEDTLSLIGAMSNSFADGGSAGTALKGLFVDFSKNKSKFEELGVSIADANGNFRQTEDIVKDLNVILADKSPIEQQEILNKLFSDTGKSAYNALSIAGDSIGTLEDKVRKAKGTTQSMADLIDSGLGPKINGMKGSMETLAIAIGDKLDDSLIKVVEKITDLVNKGTELVENWDEVVIKGREIYDNNSFLIDSIGAIAIGMTTYIGITKGVAAYQALLTASTTSGTLANTLYTTALGIKNAYMMAGGGVTGTLAAAQWALNAAMAANPIGVVVAGVGALIVGVRYAIKHFEWFRKGISFVWELMKKTPLGFLSTQVWNLLMKIEPLEKVIRKLSGGLKKLFGWKDEYSEEEIQVALTTEEERTSSVYEKEQKEREELQTTKDVYLSEEEKRQKITYEVDELNIDDIDKDLKVNVDYAGKQNKSDNLNMVKGVKVLGSDDSTSQVISENYTTTGQLNTKETIENTVVNTEEKSLITEASKESFKEKELQTKETITTSSEKISINPKFYITINQKEGQNSNDFIEEILKKIDKKVSDSFISAARLAGIL